MDAERDAEVAPASERLKPQTVDMIFDLVKDAPERQIVNSFSLDAKMMQVFQVATVVIGLAGFAGSNWALSSVGAAIALVAALLFYGTTAALAFRNLNPKLHRRSLHAHKLWPSYWNDEPIDIKHTLIADATEAYAENRVLLDRKAERIRYAIVATTIEVALVVLALVLARFEPKLFVVAGQVYRFLGGV